MDATNAPPTQASDADNLQSWTQTITVPLTCWDAWGLMWRPESVKRWLGHHARVDLRTRDDRKDRPGNKVHVCDEGRERWALADDAGVWRTARCVRARAPSTVTLLVDVPAHWDTHQKTTQVNITIESGNRSGCIIRIEESKFPSAFHDEIKRYWFQRLNRLRDLSLRVRDRRRTVHQAVVVIHGIGEQQPGETLTNLVGSGVFGGKGAAQHQWVKPDYFSNSYELRRVTLKATKTQPSTDVFEFYWANVIRDTTLSQIGSWIRQLLLRWPVPGPLLPLWFFVWGLILIAPVLAMAVSAGVFEPWVGLALFAVPLSSVLWRFFGKPLAINFIGDAARYLRPHPDNIAHRQAIREAGVSLIQKLHDSGRYDRIVLLGHSLGSVIAYDIITHSWIRMHGTHQRPGRPSFKNIIAAEKRLCDAMGKKEFQKLQHDTWRQQRANTQPWLITDLVTVGSPLTYASFLIADNELAFDQAKSNRVLPTCPPSAELDPKTHKRMTFELPYVEPVGGDTRTFVVGHHATPFGVTRWTNLYFKTRHLGLGGDTVGGAVAKQFGGWVRDVALPSPRRWFSHTWYWRRSDGSNKHLKALRGALRLNSRKELMSLLEEIPAFTLADESDKRSKH